ncbi:hypothetical protein BDY21DRAFT_61127 [Lineolata rhizophorae]|uniref:Uncharacterized protein n=1 Tax=Lineolata rhizophorae TaxID=578093 RepID=A0A6A6NWB5_9PEZI|nr:hypothetical protein BDY21DRAFT_61127 [Lineolata rhizophorae]
MREILRLYAVLASERVRPETGGADGLTEKQRRIFTLLSALWHAWIVLGTAWCILCVELTIRWNAIAGVHELGSTGQLIPFVTGVASSIRAGHDVFLILVKKVRSVDLSRRPLMPDGCCRGHAVALSTADVRRRTTQPGPPRTWSSPTTAPCSKSSLETQPHHRAHRARPRNLPYTSTRPAHHRPAGPPRNRPKSTSLLPTAAVRSRMMMMMMTSRNDLAATNATYMHRVSILPYVYWKTNLSTKSIAFAFEKKKARGLSKSKKSTPRSIHTRPKTRADQQT